MSDTTAITPVKTARRLSETAGRIHVARARYDSAQTTSENRNLWSAADCLSGDAANNLGVRMILRNRGRYVFANNSRAKGMIRTLAKHTIGPGGPRLQMLLGQGAQAKRLGTRIESEFASWAKRVRLAKKLRIARMAKVMSGEVFLKLVHNPRLDHAVKLDVQLVEADQVTNPTPDLRGVDADGVFFDQYGNRDLYRILTAHPGDGFRMAVNPNDYRDVPAAFVLHYYEEERPTQHRGVPEITPAVQLVEEGRRFRAAVLAAAETAADFAMAIQSDAPADADGAAAVDPMDEIELKRRVATVLPAGWKLAQTKAEQPTTGFKEFTRELLGEVARCIEMPLSIASLDAREANMSSSYIVNQPYCNSIDVERTDIATELLDPILDLWLTLAFDPAHGSFARRTPGAFPHVWFWPLIMEHADPAKRATGQVTRLGANLTTLSREYAREGLDWEAELHQRAKEKALMKELGLSEQEAVAPAATPTAPEPDEDDEDDAQDDEAQDEDDAAEGEDGEGFYE